MHIEILQVNNEIKVRNKNSQNFTNKIWLPQCKKYVFLIQDSFCAFRFGWHAFLSCHKNIMEFYCYVQELTQNDI